MWENVSRDFTFANCISKTANFTEHISWIQIIDLILQKIFWQFKSKKVNLAVVFTFIKLYLTLLWQCFFLNSIFPQRHFRKYHTKLQKHVLVKISFTKISYNIYNRKLRNESKRERKKRGRGNNSCHFSDQYFLVFYVNIRPTCSKTRTEYFNIKIRLLLSET